MSEEEEKKKKVGLDWKDYLAIVIAAFQTTLLPVVVFLGVLALVLVFLLLA